MSANVQLIWKKIEHLRRMRNYLDYSLEQTLLLMPINDWHRLTPENHETLAAFRVRFSEFQEHLGKIMRASRLCKIDIHLKNVYLIKENHASFKMG